MSLVSVVLMHIYLLKSISLNKWLTGYAYERSPVGYRQDQSSTGRNCRRHVDGGRLLANSAKLSAEMSLPLDPGVSR